MQAIMVEAFGDPSVLQLKEVAMPQVGAGQVVVRVKAVGINPVETYIRAGNYGPATKVPYVPGSDAGGLVEAVGDDVSGLAVGDRVYTAGSRTGTYAEWTLCDAAQVHPLPDAVSFAQGAALGVPYATAYYALVCRARAVRGETVLVHGATGGVGLAAVQISLDLGLTVIATGGTAEGRKLVQHQGVEYVFDHTAPDYRQELLGVNCGRGPDIILEMLANANLSHDLQMVAQRGRIAVIGSRGDITINPRDMMRKESVVLGIMLGSERPDELDRIHTYLGQGLAGGALRPVISAELPLAAAAAAHEKVMQHGSSGKIVLIPD